MPERVFSFVEYIYCIVMNMSLILQNDVYWYEHLSLQIYLWAYDGYI